MSQKVTKSTQLVKYNIKYVFIEKSCRELSSRLIADPFLFFKRVLYKVKANTYLLSFNTFA